MTAMPIDGGTAPQLPRHIPDIDALREHLQAAVELEHATIPPYLCGLYTIRDGHNRAAAEIIRTVAVQEMLHMVLAANVLNAVGGAPSIDRPDFVYAYPAELPVGAHGPITVALQKFSPAAIETFLAIEAPAPALQLKAAPGLEAMAEPPRIPPGQLREMLRRGEVYPSIGDFYQAIEQGLVALELLAQGRSDGTIFTGDHDRQVTSEYYYNSGGAVVTVTDLASALEALKIIVEQGEGFEHGVDDDDRGMFRQPSEAAHYYRFKQIAYGRYYQSDDDPDQPPTGADFPVDHSAAAVFDMIDNPSVGAFPAGPVRDQATACAQSYTRLLALIDRAVNGERDQLIPAVVQMFTLKAAAVALLNNPASPDGPARAGPCFDYMPMDSH
ncbi:hypothetical protein ASE86_14550 [Sphingomonas sp. Leaf33]|uniref:ferritin-like domain-containing protein n=1 Tax=Sphingomonas sp. Leaf33 TaxID=1736215 RepID=UPI0006F9C020|nr:ferritin-like protein [Sphingomonas sp. Leaf33]KQN21441.1 hypothetical protein ASE86_14550 [Sphingomonas sp. Leaf33]